MTLYTEEYRPQFHFTPQEKWMNDPNGLVYHKGIYHLFYQYYPDDIVWGPMHWGHAVSKDLISWEHKPIALYPDELGYIFSGSAVADINNTSGFGTKENPPLVAIFTYHLMEGEKAGRTDYQTQGIAYSLDNGDTWQKYEGNPVIGNDGSMKDFRDPKVFWHEASKQWIMALVAGDHAKFYSSENLKNWTFLSDFGKDKGAHGGVWECPDLFKLPVEGSEAEKWVLLISINPGAPNGGSGTQYFVGSFDGKTFTAEHDDIKWIDQGTDNYAGVTYNHVPNGDRIFIGWMSNWDYARDTPTKRWRSAMTLPRKLSLVQKDTNYLIKAQVVNALEDYTEAVEVGKEFTLPNKTKTLIENPKLNESLISFTANLKEGLIVGITNSLNDELLIGFDPVKGQVFIDRTNSGKTDFQSSFAARQNMPMAIVDKEVEVKIYLDRSSVELFVADGLYVMTAQVFPNEPYSSIIAQGVDGQQLKDFKIEPIKSIWHEK